MARTARLLAAEDPPAAERSRPAAGSGLRSLSSAASGLWDRLSVMGSGASKLEKALGDHFPEGERYFGLENFGNTCYCNSVLQALYHCVPFREQLLEYYATYRNKEDTEDNLMTCLADLFAQDAHEFWSFLLNEIVDILEEDCRTANSSPETTTPEEVSNGAVNALPNGAREGPLVTLVHRIFQGILTNETKCLTCETVTAKDEIFIDLSIDIEQNSSLTSCLKNFFSTEILNGDDKFFCDKCCSLQEAQKRMKIKKAPHILVIHLKRFKYVEQLSRHKKLSYRVVYPLELKLGSISEDADCEYSLFAVVVHVGSSPNHGHYVSQIKSHGNWLFFDDDTVQISEESTLQTFYGSSREHCGNTDHGYILFYERLGGKS